MKQSRSTTSRFKAVVLMTVLALVSTPALTASADPVASPSIAGEWTVRKCFTSGSPSWTTVVGNCFDGTWTFTTDGTATDGGGFVGTWSGAHPDFTATFDRRDGHTGSETVTGLTMTSATAATGAIRSVAECTGCGTAEGTVTLTRTQYHCSDAALTVQDGITLVDHVAETVGLAPGDVVATYGGPCSLLSGQDIVSQNKAGLRYFLAAHFGKETVKQIARERMADHQRRTGESCKELRIYGPWQINRPWVVILEAFCG